MLRACTRSGMYFAELKAERFQAARQGLAAWRKILTCRGRTGRCQGFGSRE